MSKTNIFENWTDEDVRRQTEKARGTRVLPPPDRKPATVPVNEDRSSQSKYRNQKVQADGDTFDSKGELARWRQLQMLERAGKITKLRRQVTFELAPGVILDGRKRPPLRFTADFEYYEGFWQVVEDFKNPATAAETAFKIRRHLMMAIHGIEVKIITKEG